MKNTIFVVSGIVRGHIKNRMVVADSAGEAIAKARKELPFVRPQAHKLPLKKGE